MAKKSNILKISGDKDKLTFDWTDCNKNIIEKVRYYHDNGKWYTLPTLIKVLFVDEIDDKEFDININSPIYSKIKNGCVLSFKNWKCKDKIDWNWLMIDEIELDENEDGGNGSFIQKILVEIWSFTILMERSVKNKVCLGIANLPFATSYKSFCENNAYMYPSMICDSKVAYKSNKGYYLCKTCGKKYLNIFGSLEMNIKDRKK